MDNNQLTRLGLFGGSFDPIHCGHLHIAHAFANELALDKVIFLPAGEPYHKNGAKITAQHRLKMVQRAIADEALFAVSDVDILRQGATYTIDTIHIFRQHYPSAQLWWLLGMDSLFQLHTWKNWRALIQQTHIAVAMRAGQTLMCVPYELQQPLDEALQKGSLKVLSAPVYEVSSTCIRESLVRGESVRAVLPEAVERYIVQHQLYR